MKNSRIKYSKKSSKKQRIKITFLRNYTYKTLQLIFNERISGKNNTGIDGVHDHDIEQEESFGIIRKKVSAGTYKFTSYAEIQSPKGRGKLPRIIALPTVRDQIVLSALKDYLHKIFPDDVNRMLPNSYIYKLNNEIQKIRGQSFGFIHADISGFYDNIDREKLMNHVRGKIVCPQALKLIYRAIANPVVPRNSKRSQRFRYYSPKGVPQGLAISNILANIYMSKFDKIMESQSSFYVRYVDDILILCPTNKMSKLMENLHFEVSKLGLCLNEEKTKLGMIGKDSFLFLGYKIKADGLIGIRDSSVHKKISTLAAKISSADHKRNDFIRRHDYVDCKMYQKVLIEDINEQITGALSEDKRYGWLFYYSQINDIAMLHRLDRIVTKLCERCSTFSRSRPPKIKSFVIAFREIHKLQPGMKSSYIPSYDDWEHKRKREFLRIRGQIVKYGRYTEDEIDRLFKIAKHKRLLNLERDLKNMS